MPINSIMWQVYRYNGITFSVILATCNLCSFDIFVSPRDISLKTPPICPCPWYPKVYIIFSRFVLWIFEPLYFCLSLTPLWTLTYHFWGVKQKQKKSAWKKDEDCLKIPSQFSTLKETVVSPINWNFFPLIFTLTFIFFFFPHSLTIFSFS